ncbi:Decarbamoylnovobiocin carbamoyltransferase [Stieleria bergensis]|uniref:Decarbamoylnovobiocin carbamoyltransferase n=1 Tax=Stieleria bergensis TaxID=2528025 RepID=A0A517SUS8_9BACT|nr:Decarbamoylnovobiocin carbamoyltransferase [Planctomycetes bacterium SV_7m_r]
MTVVLGISAFFHDSAAALLIDGHLVAAAQQERFSRLKHDSGFPVDAINSCLQSASIDLADVDYVTFHEKPIRKFDRILTTAVHSAPHGYGVFRKAIPAWLQTKLHLPRVARRHLGKRFTGRYLYADHHLSHAASAFYPSPFEEAAIVTVDGVGQWSTTCLGQGQGNRVQLNHQLSFPHSLGLLYSAFTSYLGFRINGGEYKVMGLAGYGQPIYRQAILENLIDLKPDGSFRLDMDFFRFADGLTMTTQKFANLFGLPARTAESELSQQHQDIAASIQSVTASVVLRLAEQARIRSKQQNLVLAGGVAMNSVANGKLLSDSGFEQVWVQPAAGDAGGALGAAWLTWHQALGQPIASESIDLQSGSRLGPAFTDTEIRQAIDRFQRDTPQPSSVPALSKSQLLDQVCQRLTAGQIVGWFQGRMEFGDRALGGRSLLADPRAPNVKQRLNQTVKRREEFRPFAPAVLEEHAHELFKLQANQSSPYMSFVVPVRQGVQQTYPAITHVDGTARVQTVSSETNPDFHALLECFFERTGCPMLVNTSFNVRSEPIVCSPTDALQCFQNTEIDALAIGNFLLAKPGATL